MSKLKKVKKKEPKVPPRFELPAGVVLLKKPKDPTKDFHCVRCENYPEGPYEWTSRKNGVLPVRCPRCSSPAWNKMRVKVTGPSANGTECHCKWCDWDWKTVKTEGIPATCPRCRKYDWNADPALPSAKPSGVK